MPRSFSAAKVRSTRVLVVGSRPGKAVSASMRPPDLAPTRFLLNLTFDARELKDSVLLFASLHLSDPLSVLVHMGEQLGGVDAEVVCGIRSHLLSPPLEQRLGSDQVPILEMVVCRTDLDEPLEEQLRLAVLPLPEVLQDLVGLEEVFLVEQADPLVDGVQARRRFRFHHQRTEEHRDNQLSATPVRRPSRPGESIVRTISGVYVPRSVTVVVMSSGGVTSNVEFIVGMRKPGQVAASYRASNFSVSHAT